MTKTKIGLNALIMAFLYCLAAMICVIAKVHFETIVIGSFAMIIFLLSVIRFNQ